MNEPTLPALPDEDRRDPRFAAADDALAGADGDYHIMFATDPDAVLVTFNDHLRCPRRGTAKRERHDEHLHDYARRFTAAGFRNVRTAACAVIATPPIERERVTARIRRTGPLGSFTQTVTFDGYTGTCTLELVSTYASAGYLAASHTGRPIHIPRHARCDLDAVREIAEHYHFHHDVHLIAERS
ncbi:hypothetical protein ACU686_26635 [Yinghuangia aomiensis]